MVVALTTSFTPIAAKPRDSRLGIFSRTSDRFGLFSFVGLAGLSLDERKLSLQSNANGSSDGVGYPSTPSLSGCTDATWHRYDDLSTIRTHRHHAKSVRITSQLRPDMIFGKDRSGLGVMARQTRHRRVDHGNKIIDQVVAKAPLIPDSNRVFANPSLRFRETGFCRRRQKRRKSA
jgi:hypothetical protein